MSEAGRMRHSALICPLCECSVLPDEVRNVGGRAICKYCLDIVAKYEVLIMEGIKELYRREDDDEIE